MENVHYWKPAKQNATHVSSVVKFVIHDNFTPGCFQYKVRLEICSVRKYVDFFSECFQNCFALIGKCFQTSIIDLQKST